MIEEIKVVLFNHGYENISAEILDAQLVGGTGGEVLISVCSKLIQIKKNEPEIFKIIEFPANGLIEYAHSLGLYPK